MKREIIFQDLLDKIATQPELMDIRCISITPNEAIDLLLEGKLLKEKNEKLTNAFHRLKSLYIAEVRSNPNHVINEQSFMEDWDKLAGL